MSIRKDFIFISPSPYNDMECVKIRVSIRKNETGEIREYDDYAIWNEDEGWPSLWIWEEGNFSCDCNRYLFFQRVNGEDENNDECGDTKYSVNITNPKDGNILYQEFNVCLEVVK